MTRPEKNSLEWAVFGLSAALIIAVASWLVLSHVRDANRPPAIRVVAGPAVGVTGGFAVPLDVHNDGDRTAERVRIEASLQAHGAAERSEAEVSFLPYRSHRRAWVTFTRDPSAGELRIRVLGYEEP